MRWWSTTKSRIVARIFFAGGCTLWGLVALRIITGDCWTYAAAFGCPFHYMVFGTLSLCIWYLIPPHQSTLTGSHIPPRLGRLILLGISFGIALIATEFAARIYLQKTQGFNSIQQMINPNTDGFLNTRSTHPLATVTRNSANKRIVYELKPEVEMAFGHRKLRINKAGMREDREYSIQKPDSTFRIVGIGDSGMWGWNVHQGEEYLSILEKRLNTEFTNLTVEVLNMAVPGYNTQQEVETIRHKALAYSPDLIVIGWCENDFSLPFFMYTRRDHFKAKTSYLWNFIFHRNIFLEMISPEVLKVGDIDEDVVDPYLLKGTNTEGVKTALSELKQIATEHNFEIILFGPTRSAITEICKELGIERFNTYEDLAETSYPKAWAVTDMHPRKDGHRLLGTALADYFIKHDRIKIRNDY